MSRRTPPQRRWVLVGLGHTHSHILQQWRRQPIRDVELICLSDHLVATYSGLLPGVLSERLPGSAMEIDLVRATAACGATLISSPIRAIDPYRREILFHERAPLAFDCCSVGVGSRPAWPKEGVADDANFVPIKPMQSFRQRLSTSLDWLSKTLTTRPLRIAVVGTGIGGLEVAFALHNALTKNQSNKPFQPTQFVLITAGNRIASGSSHGARRRLQKEIERRGFELQLEHPITRVERDHLTTESGDRIDADLVIWATGAVGHPWLQESQLPIDPQGFIQTESDLQVVGFQGIFAVGDCGSIRNQPLPKAGVFAVRQGPILWENGARFFTGRAPLPYRPQKDFLRLVDLGNGSAIGEWRGFSFAGRWALRLKRWIDLRFMKMHQDYRLMPLMDHQESTDEEIGQDTQPSKQPDTHSNTQQVSATLSSNATRAMRCRGCGSKVASHVLRAVLAELGVASESTADDIAIVDSGGFRAQAWSIDFFPAMTQDAELAGRLAALHALSDLLAKGLRPSAALAMIQIPATLPETQRRWLLESLAGAQRELNRVGCKLVGGHSIEGERLAIGFAIGTGVAESGWIRKQGVCEGDVLVLTKPLGIGVAWAAHDQALCPHDVMQATLKVMLRSNATAGMIARQTPARCATDVTGFGLAVHLSEMLGDGNCSAVVNLDQLPLIPKVLELVKAGISSSLFDANRNASAPVVVDPKSKKRSPHSVQDASSQLFDPQTCGGLLLAIPPDKLAEFETSMRAAEESFSVIGHIISRDEFSPATIMLSHTSPTQISER